MAMDDVVRSMVRDTEFEIMAEALGVETTDLPNAPSDEIEGGDDYGDVEGWNGESLDPKEIAATNLYGHPDSGQDRPLQHEEDLNYLDQLQQANERIAQLQAHNAELAQRADPELQRRLAQQREDAIVELIARPEQAFAAMSEQQAYIRQLEEGRANAALGASHRTYGHDFEAAYDALNRLDPNNPTAKQVVRGILGDPDPGRALMEWYEVAGRQGQGRLPPFLGGSGGPGARNAFRSLNSSGSGGGNQGSPFRQDYEARTDSSEEDDIMGYALGR
jgi:hypothetical protein